MDVLLINPRVDERQRPPLGLAYIAALLKKNGISVAIFDPLPSNNAKELKNTKSKFVELLRKEQPKIIGVTATTAQILLAYEFLKAAKEYSINGGGEIACIIGGPHATAMPDDVAKNWFVDFVIFGEGEYTALELFTGILHKGINWKEIRRIKGVYYKIDKGVVGGGKIMCTGQRDLIENLDELPYPARELLDTEWYSKRGSLIRGLWLKTATIITSRGCPYQCIYCASNNIFGRKLRQRSVENVIGEIKELISKYDISGIFFCDDTMTVNKRWMIEFCRAIRRDIGKKILWACQARVNTVDEELLREMKSAGCVQVEYGCESGSQKVLNALKKNITVQQIRDAFKLTKKIGIRRMANFMLGNPEEMREDVMATAKLAKEIDAEHTEFWITTPYPGSELYDMAKKNRWLKIPAGSQIGGIDWVHGHDLENPVMEINFSSKELNELREVLYSSVASSMLKNSIMQPVFVYDFLKFAATNPLCIIKGIKLLLEKGGIVKFGFYVEKRMRGNKRDIILLDS